MQEEGLFNTLLLSRNALILKILHLLLPLRYVKGLVHQSPPPAGAHLAGPIVAAAKAFIYCGVAFLRRPPPQVEAPRRVCSGLGGLADVAFANVYSTGLRRR